jgi:hypothetical protein
MLVSPLPFGALWVAFDIFSNITPGCYLALAAYLAIMFRALTRQAEGRASTAVRDARIARRVHARDVEDAIQADHVSDSGVRGDVAICAQRCRGLAHA